jgi:prepilin-type N-terminal cleavage/methylation domain-containing protein
VAENLRDTRSRKENPVQTERVSGFSLVEVMIAVAVFAIIILAIGQAAMGGRLRQTRWRSEQIFFLAVSR